MRTARASPAFAGVLACGGGPDRGAAPEPASTDGAVPAPAAAAKRYAFVVNTPSSFWTIAEAGVRKAEAELGVEVDFRMPQTGSVDEQQQILQDLLARGVDGIAISPIDPANMTALLDQVAERTLLITHDSDAPASKRLAYIGTDNVAAGRAAGAEIAKALPEGGEIVIFVGRLDAQNARERKQGIEEALAGTSIRILDTRLDQGDQARAQENAEAMLVAHPDVDALVGSVVLQRARDPASGARGRQDRRGEDRLLRRGRGDARRYRARAPSPPPWCSGRSSSATARFACSPICRRAGARRSRPAASSTPAWWW